MAKTPKLGGELPAYKTQGRPDKPKITQKSFRKSLSGMSVGTPIREGTMLKQQQRQMRTRDGYTLGGTTVKEGTMLMRRPAKQTVSRKRPLGPTR